mgnify:CR=1 FL=1
MQVIVRDNNVDQAIKVLKKKLQREGVFREKLVDLWRSRERYLERAHAARSFVLRNCSLSTFPGRLAALFDSNQRATSSADSSIAAGG